MSSPRQNFDFHEFVGIDFDGTLIDHAKSHYLRRKIKENKYDQKFWIITFRSKNDADTIWDELKPFGLTENHFQSIDRVPSDLDDRYQSAQGIMRWRGINQRKFLKILEYYNTTEEEIKNDIEAFMMWKAETCVKLGCTLLVDDMEIVRRGCIKLNIKYLHPDFI